MRNSTELEKKQNGSRPNIDNVLTDKTPLQEVMCNNCACNCALNKISTYCSFNVSIQLKRADAVIAFEMTETFLNEKTNRGEKLRSGFE
jgi:hypothetical protein